MSVDLTLILIYTGIGLTAGFMSGMFGIGGGSIRIPLLNFAGLPLITAFGINLFAIPFSSAVGAASQKDNIDRKIVVYVIIGGAIGSVVGALSVGLVSKLALAIMFFITAIITVLLIYLVKIAPNLSEKIKPSKTNLTVIPFFLNLITGMRGGSGGSLFPPFLKVMKLDVHRAIATSIFVTMFTASIAIMIYWQRGDIDWLPAIFVLVGSMAGARLGSVASLKTKPKWLEAGLSIMVIVLALLTVWKAL